MKAVTQKKKKKKGQMSYCFPLNVMNSQQLSARFKYSQGIALVRVF